MFGARTNWRHTTAQAVEWLTMTNFRIVIWAAADVVFE
jgi:hypothetical protein